MERGWDIFGNGAPKGQLYAEDLNIHASMLKYNGKLYSVWAFLALLMNGGKRDLLPKVCHAQSDEIWQSYTFSKEYPKNYTDRVKKVLQNQQIFLYRETQIKTAF